MIPCPLRAFYAGVVPVLRLSGHKGECGKLAVLGGSKAYTGAPFFAAMSALKLGADLATVVCTSDPSTSAAIKSLAPDIVVRPSLVAQTEMANEFFALHHQRPEENPSEWKKHMNHATQGVFSDLLVDVFPRVHCLVVGPGLGLDEPVRHQTLLAIKEARRMNLPIVIDGDAISLVALHPEAIKGYASCVLTPNAAEFRRLWEATMGRQNKPPPMSIEITAEVEEMASRGDSADTEGGLLSLSSPLAVHAVAVARGLDGVTIVRKGPVDVITDGHAAIVCARSGSMKRCGGQGDVCAGAVGTFFMWTTAAEKRGEFTNKQFAITDRDSGSDSPSSFTLSPPLVSAYLGCLVTRRSASLAWSRHGRSTLAAHVVEHVEDVTKEWFTSKL